MASRHHEVYLETLLIAEVVQVPGPSCADLVLQDL